MFSQVLFPMKRLRHISRRQTDFCLHPKPKPRALWCWRPSLGGAPVIAVRATGVEDLVEDGADGILTEEDTSEYAAKVAEFLEGVPAYERDESRPETILNIRNKKMAENALQKAFLFREEAVALKAIHYYNSVIAENAAQQKRNIRLLPAG